MRARGRQEKLSRGGHTRDPSTTGSKTRTMNGSHRLPTGWAALRTSACLCHPRAQQPATGTIRAFTKAHRYLPQVTLPSEAGLAGSCGCWGAAGAPLRRRLAPPLGRPRLRRCRLVGGEPEERKIGHTEAQITDRAWRQGPAEELRGGLRPRVSPSASWASVAPSVR